jgi:RNA polymerase sigma-70 factor, ECF subfamily
MFTQDALVNEMNHLRRFALRLTGNASDADDLLQSTLLRAMENSELFQTDTNLFRWSSKIMFNLFVSGYRRRTKFETQFDPDTYLQKESVPATQEISVDLATVRRAIKQLSLEHRQILVLVCVKGMRYEEVSEFLQIPVGTVRSRLSRAREQLQAVMEAPNEHGPLPDWLPAPVPSQAAVV